MSNSFLNASKVGDLGQTLVSNYLNEKGYEVEEAPNMYFPDWDIKGIKGGREITIEVKYDKSAYWWAARRGTPEQPNLYIEFRSTKREEDTGIRKSIADFYFYIMKTGKKHMCYVFDRVKLLKHLEESSYKVVNNSAKGDDNAEGWIPPLHEILTNERGYKAVINLTDYE